MISRTPEQADHGEERGPGTVPEQPREPDLTEASVRSFYVSGSDRQIPGFGAADASRLRVKPNYLKFCRNIVHNFIQCFYLIFSEMLGILSENLQSVCIRGCKIRLQTWTQRGGTSNEF